MAEQNNAAFIWSIAQVLRGTYKPAENGKVILPFTVLRRLDSALESTKQAVLEAKKQNPISGAQLDFLMQKASKYSFYNTSPYDLKKIAGDPANLKANLVDYIAGFSPNVRDIFDKYEFEAQLAKLDEKDLLLLLVQKFSQIDLHPERVSNTEMGMIFEELIRQFAELSNETAGEHFTPRDVVRLIVNLLFANDDEVLSKKGVVRTVYDPTAGTGGMLSVADDYIRHLNPDARLTLFGQELNDESYAIAKADMVIKGQAIENMISGNTLTEDGHHGKHFDYCLSNPPFGVKWEKEQSFVKREHEQQGFLGRFGPGLPKITDGALLFVMHLLKKMRPKEAGGGRAAVVLSASAFYNGDAGSGYSEIRKHLLTNDLVDAIVGLPDSMFYNTGIPTYVWILDNDKPDSRKGKVQLIDASDCYERRRKSLGEKRKDISKENVLQISSIYAGLLESENSKVFRNEDFEYEVKRFEVPFRVRLRSTKEIELISGELVDNLVGSGLVTRNAATSIVDLCGNAPSASALVLEVQNFVKGLGLKLSLTQLLDLLEPVLIWDRNAEVLTDRKGKPLFDTKQSFSEKAPVGTDWDRYLADNVSVNRLGAVLSTTDSSKGFEILWARIFARPTSTPGMAEIDEKIFVLREKLMKLIGAAE